MKTLIWRLTFFLKKRPYWLQIIIFFFLSLLIALGAIPFRIIIDKVLGENISAPKTNSWFVLGIIAPLFETFINQYVPFKLFQNYDWLKNKYGLYILSSALVFGLMHWYSIQYIIFAFSVGLVLGYSYFFYSKTPIKAFWSTTLLHSLRNTLSFLLVMYGGK